MATANNITRDEARRRAQLLEVASYDVTLDLLSATTDAQTFRSVSTATFRCSRPGESTYVDLTAPSVTEITLNGERVDPATAFDGNRITLPALQADNVLTVVADCAYMRTGEGLHRFTDPVDGEVYLYSQFETFDAHRMFACFDQPDLKSVFTFRVIAPEHWQVVSNMPGTTASIGTGTEWTFEPTPRQSSYITALVAGPYAHVHDEHDGIPLGIYARQSLADYLEPDEVFTVTRQGLDAFHALFGVRYPWPKYDQLFVPEFNAGAMENPGAVTFLEDYVFRSKVTDAAYERRASTVLHEMAHMWFGDLVTMRWWDDLWLNESFADYMAVLVQAEATRWPNAWTTFATVEKTWAYRQDQLPSTHPIAADIVDNEAVKVNFDGITYAKGASVLKQLVAWVGRDEFFSGVREYFRRHAYGNTTLGDLLGALEESSGRELSSWSKEWLETAGVNTLRPRLEVDEAGNYTSFAILQEAPEEHPTLRSHRIAVGLYDHTDEGLVRRDRVELDVVGAVTEVPQLVGVRQPDLVLLNDDDLTYTKIRLDERSLATLVHDIGSLRNTLTRALCWTAAWDMTRDAEMPASAYVDLVLAGIRDETDIGVVQSLLRQARAAAESYVAPQRRDAVVHKIAAASLAGAQGADPSSDHQLAWVRSFVSAATDPDHVDVVRRLLAGDDVLTGLTVDTDLRWHLLNRLVVLGVAGEDEIAAEFERDRTAAGERHAAAARAAMPTAAAKEEAWRLAVEAPDTPNAVQAAVIGGFAQVEQRELLRPFVDRYFDAVARVWADKTIEMAQNVVIGFYPGLLVEEATIARTDDYLRTADPVPALRRLLLEGRAGVVRALRAQERDAAQGADGAEPTPA